MKFRVVPLSYERGRPSTADVDNTDTLTTTLSDDKHPIGMEHKIKQHYGSGTLVRLCALITQSAVWGLQQMLLTVSVS